MGKTKTDWLDSTYQEALGEGMPAPDPAPKNRAETMAVLKAWRASRGELITHDAFGPLDEDGEDAAELAGQVLHGVLHAWIEGGIDCQSDVYAAAVRFIDAVDGPEETR
jgi:hypothetical protein